MRISVAAVEALLFVSAGPVTIREICAALEAAEVQAVRAALETLRSRYAHEESGIRLHQVGGGWQIRTEPGFAESVRRLIGVKPKKLSKASLEVLSVIAYRQPVTKPEIDEIRGVDSGGVVRKLLGDGVIRVSGRRLETPGRPLEYATTRAFLELFDLKSLGDLPTISEFEELDAESRPD